MSVQVLVIYIFLEISPCPLSFQMYWNKAVRVCYVLVSQLCLTLWDPMDCSLPGSCVNGILQARTLEWVAIPFSRGSSQPRIGPRSPALQADSLLSDPPGKPFDIEKPFFFFILRHFVI